MACEDNVGVYVLNQGALTGAGAVSYETPRLQGSEQVRESGLGIVTAAVILTDALAVIASGKPVIVTRGCGLIESVVDGAPDPAVQDRMLARRLTMLLKYPDLAERMGQAGRRHVEEHFSRRRIAADLADLYSQSSVDRGRYPPIKEARKPGT
jgi:glycosyltransferase involved in cell wall biosynthesis